MVMLVAVFLLFLRLDDLFFHIEEEIILRGDGFFLFRGRFFGQGSSSAACCFFKDSICSFAF